jgi:hypothetical protein
MADVSVAQVFGAMRMPTGGFQVVRYFCNKGDLQWLTRSI